MSKAKNTADAPAVETAEVNPTAAETADAAAERPAALTVTEDGPAPKSAGFACYLGPSIHGVIQTATIYPAGREEAMKLPEVKLALSKRPEIAALIVDGSTLAEDRIKVKQPGTPLYEAYRALKKKAGG